jgi:RNA polymerase sigma-70 factor (ECF subfamily)
MDRVDWTLFGLARSGDRAAFESILKHYRSTLERSISLRLGASLRKRLEVEDVYQETSLRAFRDFGGFRGDCEGQFRSWLETIAARVVLEEARRLRMKKADVRREVPLDAGAASFSAAVGMAATDPTPSRVLRREERFDRLRAAMKNLSPDHRKVILLARVQRLPLVEVARRMSRTPKAASMLLVRAMLQLREQLAPTDSVHLPPGSLEVLGEDD